MPVVLENIARETALMTDEGEPIQPLGPRLRRATKPSNSKRDEYDSLSRRPYHNQHGRRLLLSVFKRGMKGVYQHCREKHLHRYLAEFDFRYSNRSALGVEDGERAAKALKGIEGKRLTYRISCEATAL